MKLLAAEKSNWVMIFMTSLLIGCVGPTTPFGALNDLSIGDETNSRQPATNPTTEINFHPTRQVLHDKVDFTIEVKDDHFIPYEYKVQVFHNNYDVTQEFLNQSQAFRSNDGKQILFTVKDFRLKTLDPNKIRVVFQKDNKTQVEASYKAPLCSLFDNNKLKSLGKFKAPNDFKTLIEKVALTANHNPSFLAGIVAQESSFNPKAVSWAKALGLTQMTPVAEKEVIGQFTEWPRHPGINSYTYATLKTKIYMGEIDEKSEWRLDPQKSLEGGAAYIQYLTNYWNMDKNKAVLKSLKGDADLILSEVILASYNSGAARVKSAIVEKNENWKKHPNLKEAVKYIKKVSSYCFHYSEEEVPDDHET